jgi:hypothetical protein
MPNQSHSVRQEQQGRGESLEAYLLEHVLAYESTRHCSQLKP